MFHLWKYEHIYVPSPVKVYFLAISVMAPSYNNFGLRNIDTKQKREEDHEDRALVLNLMGHGSFGKPQFQKIFILWSIKLAKLQLWSSHKDNCITEGGSPQHEELDWRGTAFR